MADPSIGLSLVRALTLSQTLPEAAQKQAPESIVNSIEDVIHGRYTDVLKRYVFTPDSNTQALEVDGNVDQFIQDRNLTDPYERLVAGIACLNAFVQINWTGPLLEWTSLKDLLPQASADDLDQKVHKHCLQSLSADSEEVYHLTQHLGLLAAARSLLVGGVSALWALRAVFIQQQLLDEHAGSLQESLLALAAQAENEAKDDDELKTRVKVDIALMQAYYGLDKESFEKLQEAQQLSGFEWSLTGALGRRTKFQTFDTSQLVVLAESRNTQSPMDEDKQRPETLELEDDTLLERVKFADTDTNKQEADKRHGNLQVIDQCLLLAFCLNVKNTNPDHGLTSEQMMPYVTRVLENANNWMVHTMGLLQRTRLECNKSRTVERSALQLQALVDQIKVEDSGVDERLSYFYELLLPSKWEMERELAKRFVSLGVLRSALDIFERLEMWEEVIACHQMLEQPHKAKEVLANLMKDAPDSPKFLCILGDLEQDPEHWRKAWEISGNRFARAMRSLGAYHYKLGEFDESIECYQKALAINPLFEGSWYILGCAAMHAENWEVGVRAFQRVVALDHEQAEGWNNLSSIYVHLDRKPDAFLALKQATKLKFDSWKMWQNLLIVATDVGQFADAIWAMQRVVELRWDKVREEAVDTDVLRLLVENVIQNWKDAFDRDGKRLERQVQRLLEDVILSRISTSPEIWRICSKFYMWQEKYAEALEASIKAYRVVMHDARIEIDQAVLDNVASLALETVDMYETVGEKEQDGKPVCADWKYQSRLILKGLMGKARDNFEDTESYERLKERLDDLKR
ncbi:hypothetical protein BCR43DRAFT_490680 [Syncephalastrum racemosum]|uniref:Uncharacterized protein n=1 Tax=Syncephalastrum racemosum TaxID=13706 RepID=A0A1X2HGD1_SYNRA|nr:hypothetical protein BCR43DRAFT_490680 [Syncephalastrum racemosum]